MSRSRWLLLTLLLLGLLLYLPYRLQLRETAVLDAAARQQLGGTYLALPQGVVHYELAGPAGAPVVVLVHGFSVPSYLWDRTVVPLQQAGYRVLRFDLYGRGYSDRPDVDYGLDVYVSQLRDLLAGLQLRQPLLGDYLASVALVPKVRSSLATLVHDPASFPDFEQRFDRQAAYAGYARALLRTVRYLDGRDFLADYRALAQTGKPVQLIWGENDRLVPIEQAQWLQQALPGVPLQRIARSGHLPQYEHPQQVNRLLLDFLQRQHPAASAKR
jgi:pimeloyl-ACP methyl ester carboxylesterase